MVGNNLFVAAESANHNGLSRHLPLRFSRLAPRLKASNFDYVIFDLPPVIARAGPALESSGLRDRVTLHPGSFREDPVPKGYDLVSLVRVLHDHDDSVAAPLLRSIREDFEIAGRPA